MNATMVASGTTAVPREVSSIQEVPLAKIRESKTNPRRFFDEAKLAELADFVPGNKILIVLGHTTNERLVDSEQTARHIREVEAESVALICCETLGLEGAESCRGYIQHWLKTEKEIPNQSAARIFAAASSILKAGTSAAGRHLGAPRWRV